MSILLCCALACTEKADLDPKEKRLVVVECILREDSVQRLYLNFSSRLYESNYPPIEEAEAFIDEYQVEENDSTRVARYAFYKVADGKWESAFSPKVEHIYKLNVNVPGYPIISARTKISRGNFSAGVTSPPNSTNLKIYRIDTCGTDTKHEHISASSAASTNSLCYLQIAGYRDEQSKVDLTDSSAFWIYGMDFNPVSSRFEIAEYIYSCHPGADKFNLSDKKGAQLPQLQKPKNYNKPDYLDCLEYGLPMYLSIINKYCNVADEFFNIRYIRIPISVFRSYELDAYNERGEYFLDSVAYHIPTEIHKGYGATYTPSFNPYYEGIAHPYAHIVVEQVSADYDKYLKDVLSFHYGLDMKTEQDELTHLYEYRDIYTNIINGTGIFGWSKRRMDLWANYSRISRMITHNGLEIRMGIDNKNYQPGGSNEINRIIKEYYRKYGDPNIR